MAATGVISRGQDDIRHRSLGGIGSEAVVDTRGSLYRMAREVGERIIANLDAM